MNDDAERGSDTDGTFLGIDLGTTNVKAQVVTGDGRVLSSGSAAVRVTHSPGGAAEQDIEEIWTSTLTAVWTAVEGRGTSVRSIGVSSQGGAIQLHDSRGAPWGPVIGWQDSRGGPWDLVVTERLGEHWWAGHTGYARSASAVGQVLRVRELAELPRDFTLGWVGDEIVGRLCGVRAHDATSLSEAGLCNPHTGAANEEVLALIGLNPGRLPELRGPTRAAAGLLPGIARQLGLTAGIPVGPAVHDQYASTIGCGAVRRGDTMLGTGTAWVILALIDHFESPVLGVSLVGRHPVDGLYGHLLSMGNGGSCLAWATGAMGLGSQSGDELDALLSSAPPGAAGLSFRPLLAEIGGAGLRPDMAGRIDGLRLEHTPAHILRALVEGLACELGRYLRMMANAGVGVERLIMCGKAAASRVTPQIVADTVGLPVDCASLPETSSLGAAILARALVEKNADLTRLSDLMKSSMRRVAPSAARAADAARLERYLRDLASGGE